MLIVATCCFGIAFCSLFLYEYKASLKRKELKEAVRFVATPFPKEQSCIESVSLGSAAGGVSLLEIYLSTEKHSAVLEVIEQRYNRILGPDTTTWEWYEKIEELQASGADSVANYVNAYVGQAGEDAALEYLNKLGYKAELFESRVHPNDDIRVYLNDDTAVDYSVKSYMDANDFSGIVAKHPDSTHYVVNSELYEKLEDTGKLSEYNAKGIEIIDGHFSHAEHISEASDAFDSIVEAGDIADNIPWLSLVFLGYRTVNNAKQYFQQRQSGYELGVNVGGDVVRIGSTGVGAVVGAKLGTMIGTVIAPGIGSVVGGIIGVVAGGIMVSSIVKSITDKIKWGEINESLDYFGQIYDKGLSRPLKENIKTQILQSEQLSRLHSEEEQLLSIYEDILDPYSFFCKPTLPAVLAHAAKENYKARLVAIERAMDRLESKLRYFSDTIGAKLDDNEGKIKRRYLGELIINNYELLYNNCESSLTNSYYDTYQQQLAKAPNHPYRFNIPPKDIFLQIVKESYHESFSLSLDRFHKKRGLRFLIILLFICFFGMAGALLFKII